MYTHNAQLLLSAYVNLINVYIHKYILIYTYIYMYIHTHTYIHVYA